MDMQSPTGEGGLPLGGGEDGGQPNGSDGGGGDVQPEGPQEHGGSARGRPRVRGELGWRERAEDAERRVEELESELSTARASLATAEGALEASERARAIDAALVASDAIDLDTARLLVEREMRTGDAADAESAVAAVRKAKPFLFGAGEAAHGAPEEAFALSATGSASASGSAVGRPLAAMADEARSTGDRRLLLRYLRARRSAP